MAGSDERFAGFPPEALAFYAGLILHNDKAWWEANRAGYEAHVRRPMLALAAELDEEYRPLKVFRPYRDVRFSKDKTPYKTHIGAYGEGEGGSGFYVQLSAEGLYTACGYHVMESDQLARWREAVAGEDGARLPALIADARAAGLALEPGIVPQLKRGPRGWPLDHPRADLLRWKGIMSVADFGDPAWLHTREALDRVQGAWRAAAPLLAWLDTHVGPSRELPPEARAFLGG